MFYWFLGIRSASAFPGECLLILSIYWDTLDLILGEFSWFHGKTLVFTLLDSIYFNSLQVSNMECRLANHVDISLWLTEK